MDEWEETIARFMLKHTRADLDAEAAKRGIWLGSVSSLEDIMANEQLKARGYFSEVEYPEKGTVTFLGAPFKSNEVSWKTGLRAPRIGEHNWEIYTDEIGLSEEEYSRLREARII
jgi:formyl-CoA transferase